MLTPTQIIIHNVLRNAWKLVFPLIIFVPLVEWFLMTPLTSRFGDTLTSMTSLGQIAGIVGTLLFSFSLIASYRNRIIEKLFGGLDTLYRIHHLFGMYGLFLLLVHPLLLSFQYVSSSLEEGMYFFIPFKTSTAIDFGIFSLLSFIVFIGLTLFGLMFAYQHLKIAHKLLGAAFLLGAIHGFLIQGDIASNMFIRYWVLGFAGLGICMYVLYSFFKKYTVKKYTYTIYAVTKITNDITEIAMTPVGKHVETLPGQFVFFSFRNSQVLSKESHPFTISSWLPNGDIVLSAKSLGDFTSLLSQEKIGELVEVEGPYGEFSYLYGNKKQVWVAGGIGVTPFVAMVEHMLTLETLSYSVEFFYSVRTKNDVVYDKIFEKASLKFPSFVYYPIPSDTEGYITSDLLIEKVTGITTKDIFICGPPPMMNALIVSLTKLGIKKKHIHSEQFTLLK